MRNRALSIYAATGATGFSLGLVFGGLLTEIGWRWVFLLPGPDRADHADRGAQARAGLRAVPPGRAAASTWPAR